MIADIIGVGDGGRGHIATLPSQKKSGKIFFGRLLCKIWVFSGKKYVKLRNFVNFSVKKRVKFGHFVNLSYIFFGQKCFAPYKNVLPSKVEAHTHMADISWDFASNFRLCPSIDRCMTHFIRATAYAIARICNRPSVRLSVTRVD